ncbi:MAG TPA: FAD-binding protein [Ktedonobacterales bacterium]|jgi:hypothetical protein
MAQLIERPPDSYIPPVIRKQRPPGVDTKGLAAGLRRQIAGEVRFDDGGLALYATDGSNYRQVPIGVVVPRSTDDVVQTVALRGSYGAPVQPRGCGTSLAGNCCNVAVVIDCSKYLHHILALNPQQKQARVQPGVIPDKLFDGAVMGSYDAARVSVVAPHQGTQIFRINALAQGGRAGHIGKEDSHQFALFGHAKLLLPRAREMRCIDRESKESKT